MFDYLFEFTEDSEMAGEQFLVECSSLTEAWDILEKHGFLVDDVQVIKRMSVHQGELLGLDTY